MIRFGKVNKSKKKALKKDHSGLLMKNHNYQCLRKNNHLILNRLILISFHNKKKKLRKRKIIFKSDWNKT